MNKYIVEIRNKKEIFDAAGQGVKHGIFYLGIKNVTEVSTAQLYVISGDISYDDIIKLAEELLTDNITQEYSIYTSEDKLDTVRNVFVIDVFFKPGVTDTVGETAFKASKDIGVDSVKEAHTGFRYFISGKLDNKTLEKICNRLLANTVVQQYKIL